MGAVLPNEHSMRFTVGGIDPEVTMSEWLSLTAFLGTADIRVVHISCLRSEDFVAYYGPSSTFIGQNSTPMCFCLYPKLFVLIPAISRSLTDPWYMKGQKAAIILMAERKTAVTPLLTHWSYCSLTLSHRYYLSWTHHYGATPPFPCVNIMLTHITNISRGPFHKRFFDCNTNLMEISFCSHPSCSQLITMKFCTWHDSSAVHHVQNFVVIWYLIMELH